MYLAGRTPLPSRLRTQPCQNSPFSFHWTLHWSREPKSPLSQPPGLFVLALPRFSLPGRRIGKMLVNTAVEVSPPPGQVCLPGHIQRLRPPHQTTCEGWQKGLCSTQGAASEGLRGPPSCSPTPLQCCKRAWGAHFESSLAGKAV